MNTRYLQNPPPPKVDLAVDEETGEPLPQKKVPKGKPISHEEVLELEYKALVQEGQVLYYRNEFYRAIEAFTKASTNNKDDLGILIDRANCYIQVGNTRAALTDINAVLHKKPEDTRAILAKAEAFFSMGEFEFALVFFEKGLAIRTDLAGFRDGVSKSKNAILDSINGEKPFQPNPNFAASRPRKPLMSVKKKTPLVVEDEEGGDVADFLPDPVPPLTLTQEAKSSFLGELALDYDYLVELREEIIAGSEDGYGEKEDKKILAIVNDALIYLNQRAQFWSQQGGPQASPDKRDAPPDQTARGSTVRKEDARPASKVRITKVQSGDSSARRGRGTTDEQAHYELSKIQVYEAKYGRKTP
jgi:tetratricopeptide (TPR) repeat protein